MKKSVIFIDTLFGLHCLICVKQNDDNYYIYRIQEYEKNSSYCLQMFAYDYNALLIFEEGIGQSFDFEYTPDKHIIEHFENILNGYLEIFKEK